MGLHEGQILDPPCGKLRGSIERSCLDYNYLSYKGIPYAKPPVGSLRFKDPEPLERWEYLRDARGHGSRSVQWHAVTKSFRGSEDCLYLNVYTRNAEYDSRAPVMVWIHGGAFAYGSGNDEEFGPDYLLQKDVVLVTINYRLGIFGFLDLEDEIQTGNQGLKDQVMALKWVKTNIRNFGGDPDNVTIFGGSAGAACVHYLTISPMATGLFHRAICQSSTALNLWALKHEPRKTLYTFLELLGCKEREPKAILAYLKSADPYKLIETQEKMFTPLHWLQLNFAFVPSIDNKSLNPFMPENLSAAIEEGVQVPLMVGFNSLEGLLILKLTEGMALKDLNQDLKRHATPSTVNFYKNKYNLTISELKKMYFEEDEVSELNLLKFLEFWSDYGFNEGIQRLLRIQYKHSAASTYFYKLSFHKNISLIRRSIDKPITGVCHGDELLYLFKSDIHNVLGIPQLEEGTGAHKIMNQMVEMWTNFARTGRPTLHASGSVPVFWQPNGSDVILRYLNIDEKLHMDRILSLECRYTRDNDT